MDIERFLSLPAQIRVALIIGDPGKWADEFVRLEGRRLQTLKQLEWQEDQDREQEKELKERVGYEIAKRPAEIANENIRSRILRS